MKRRLKNRIAFVLVAFFALGILCSTLAAPTQAIASVTGCSEMPGHMAMVGCEHPSYLCGFDPARNLLSSASVSSVRPSDSLKHILGSAIGDLLIDVSPGLAPTGAREWKNIHLAEPGKVSLRLANSVLNL